MMAALKTVDSRPEYLIVGLGVTGYSCAKFLSGQGTAFRVVDSRSSPPMLAAFEKDFSESELSLGGLDVACLQGIKTLILSPGVSKKELFVQKAIQQGIELIGDIELFVRHANADIVAITGSNGKSTVTTLLGDMIKAAGLNVQMGGNLGTPALELIVNPAPDFYLLELSSFQLELTDSLSALASVVLNVSEDHMDRYADFDEYVASKERIYKNSKNSVFNKDDNYLNALSSLNVNTDSNHLFFTQNAPLENEFGLVKDKITSYLAFGSEFLLNVNDLFVKGAHNYANMLAALALGRLLELPMPAMLAACKKFKGLPHRCQWVAEANGVTWINDSKATNAGAAQASILSMQSKIVLIAGGVAKGADLSVLIPAILQKAHAVVLIGKDAPLLQALLEGHLPLINANSMKQAVIEAHALVKPGDTVLLAPACASLDMYSNYIERGEDFVASVHEVIQS